MAVGTAVSLLGGAASAYSAIKGANQNNMPQGGTPLWQQQQQQRLNAQANNVNQQYAGFTPDQLAAMQGIRDMVGQYNPDYDYSQGLAQQYAQEINPEDIQRFMNPFEDQVVSQYIDDLGTMRGEAVQQSNAAANAAGAFGGSRHGVSEGQMLGDMYDSAGRNISALRYQGWDNAGQMALNARQLGIAGNAQLQNLIGQRINYDVGDMQRMMSIGGMQQAHNQNLLNAPLETLRFRNEINNGGSYQAPTYNQRQDPFAAGLAGFQNGYGATNDAWNWLGGIFKK